MTNKTSSPTINDLVREDVLVSVTIVHDGRHGARGFCAQSIRD